MFFVPCIVIQSSNVNQQMHTCQIVLIQFLVSSTSFEHQVFHHQEDHLYMQFLYGVFHAFM